MGLKEILPLFPFVLLLLTIAFFPLARHELWEKNSVKAFISILFGAPVVIFLLSEGKLNHLLHVAEEYFSFISLITSLFIVSGGLFIDIKVPPSPVFNTLILLFGSVLSNIIGTTGASMLLIRPFLRINRLRENTFHLPIFFIFTVSNIGGALTPIGDPPLFMGFLKGVPFFWSLKLFPIWILEIGLVLTAFFVWDLITLKKERKLLEILEESKRQEGKMSFTIKGKINFFFLLMIIISVIFLRTPLRELVMWVSASLSWVLTPKDIRERNEFSFEPAKEVAIVFAGIFATMTPVLDFLRENADKFGVDSPWEFFFTTGVLSSFLDNAPTYLTFFAMAQGITEKFGLTPSVAGVWEPFLKAISAGAVFMGANSYIGNAPNFMVKSISEEMKIKAPNFIFYMFYSFIILIPSYFLIAFLFFGFPK